ncbi:MAG: DUF6504 family protein [bacterium]|nr:DUF6504 family protein [bacterium]
MSTFVNERIKVYTVFNTAGRKLVPVTFVWSGRTYRVEEVTYTWESRHGATTFLHFAVRAGADLFELVFNTHAMTWELRAVTSLLESQCAE